MIAESIDMARHTMHLVPTEYIHLDVSLVELYPGHDISVYVKNSKLAQLVMTAAPKYLQQHGIWLKVQVVDESILA